MKNDFEDMIRQNSHDLTLLGLLFLRLLYTDSLALDSRPSPTLFMAFSLEQEGTLGLERTLASLFSQLDNIENSRLTDGFNRSILRM